MFIQFIALEINYENLIIPALKLKRIAEHFIKYVRKLMCYFTYFSPSSHPTLLCFFPVGLSL